MICDLCGYNAGWDIDKLIGYICRELELDERLLFSKGRNNKISYAKALVCYFAVRELGLSTSAVAARLTISQPAVSQSVKRGELLREKLRLDLDS